MARGVSRPPRSERAETSERLERHAAEVAAQPLSSRRRPVRTTARGSLADRRPGGRRRRGDLRRGTRRHRTRRLHFCRGRARRGTLMRYGSRRSRVTSRLAGDPMALLATPIAAPTQGSLLVAPARLSHAVPPGFGGAAGGAVPVPSVAALAEPDLGAAAAAVEQPEGARRVAPLPGTGHGGRGDGHSTRAVASSSPRRPTGASRCRSGGPTSFNRQPLLDTGSPGGGTRPRESGPRRGRTRGTRGRDGRRGTTLHRQDPAGFHRRRHGSTTGNKTTC
jgi:hypothetical protein